MARESLEDFLSFMSEKPRTWDWDAIVAYDRNTTNDLLMQEYIERFKSDAYFETLTFAVPITQGWQISEGQRLDKPRLKFEAAELGDSTADLSMRIVGGRQFHVGLDLNRGYRFNSIKLADALNGPVLHVRLRLGNTPGHIEPVYKGEAKVVIDLSNPTWDFYLTFSDYPEENRVGGARYKEIFSNWHDEKKKLTLNTLKVAPDDFVQPASFLIRTHAEPNAADGEGAVLLFVTMQGGENGKLPANDKDFHYLLPDAPIPYTTNLIFSQRFFLQRLMAKWFAGLNSANEERPFEFEALGDREGGFIEGIKATQGVLYMPPYKTAPGAEPYLDFQNGFKLAFAPDEVWGEGEFTLTRYKHDEGRLLFLWTGKNNSYLVARANDTSGVHTGESDFIWEGSGIYCLEIDGTKKCSLKLEQMTAMSVLDLRPSWEEALEKDPSVAAIIAAAGQ
ncbi:hypothetical protein [Pseudomonas sp. NPDC089758]|uniref:hypothetical protein n=1 Tax=Pseudomonas sp. NPDC089758 TaxID=3364473 RepID=UPI0038027730